MPAINIPSSGSSLPIDDGTAVVKGSADATKLVRIEADGLSTGTTRVITMPDANVDLTGLMHLAGTETVTGAKTFTATVTAETLYASGGTLSLGVGSALRFAVTNNAAHQYDSIGNICVEIKENTRISLVSGSQYAWASSATAAWSGIDTGLKRAAAGVVGVTDGSTGGGILEFLQVASGGTPSTDSVRLYAKDSTGAKLHFKNEDGTEQQVVGTAVAQTITAAKTFTGQVILEGSSSTPTIIRQTGGVAGTDEGQHYHDGTDYYIVANSGAIKCLTVGTQGLHVVRSDAGGGTYYLRVVPGEGGSETQLQTVFDLRLIAGGPTVGSPSTNVVQVYRRRLSLTNSNYTTTNYESFLECGLTDGVIRVLDGTTTGGIVELAQRSSGGTPASNSTRIYSKDSAGTAEGYWMDEAGNETLQTPHAHDAPAWLYDDDEPCPRMDKELQHYLGYVRYTNDTRAARIAGKTDAEKTAMKPDARRCVHQETFDEHNARLGLTGDRALKVLVWEEVQAQHQTDYDTARAAELKARDEHNAGRAADQANLDLWQSLPDEAKEGTTSPTVRSEFAGNVRDAKDVRKPVPERLKGKAVRGGGK